MHVEQVQHILARAQSDCQNGLQQAYARAWGVTTCLMHCALSFSGTIRMPCHAGMRNRTEGQRTWTADMGVHFVQRHAVLARLGWGGGNFMATQGRLGRQQLALHFAAGLTPHPRQPPADTLYQCTLSVNSPTPTPTRPPTPTQQLVVAHGHPM
jgi:hypothetical protein